MPADITPLVSRIITDVRFRSDVSDEKVLLDAQGISDIITQANKGKPPAPSLTTKLLSFVKPTFIVNTPMGQRIVAPYGVSDPRAPSVFKGRVKLALGGVVLGLVAIGFGLGRWSKK